MVVGLQEKEAPKRLHVTLVAHSEGAGSHYTIREQSGMDRVTISREITELRFPFDCTAWATHTAQRVYRNVPISQIGRGCERPAAVRLADSFCTALARAYEFAAVNKEIVESVALVRRNS